MFLLSGLDDGARASETMPTWPTLYFENMAPGQSLTSPPHRIDRNELLGFARAWDPLPFHVNEQAGNEAFGSLTAPGLYMLAVKQRLIHQLPPQAVIASLGYDEVRFHRPLRPGDTVVLRQEWMERRPSQSKPDRGIVTLRFSLINQDGATVMSHLDTILVRRRGEPQ
jgi:acyl dehydratase